MTSRNDDGMMLAAAIGLAAKAHADQVDKTGEPYIMHPLRVMMQVEGIEAKVIAVLHDVVEDTGVSLNELAHRGFPAYVVNAVDALSRPPGMDYTAYIGRMVAILGEFGDTVRAVKLADLRDNMDLNRLVRLDEKTRTRLLAKYQTGFAMLVGARQLPMEETDD